ncbi:hypothetical protein ACXET9_08280 [Brachybacterium sp. DNPG3]
MRNTATATATSRIATSRTAARRTAAAPAGRAASAAPIAYRPLPELWGDVESLRTIRALRAEAAARGIDPSLLEIDADELAAATAPSRAPGTAVTAGTAGAAGTASTSRRSRPSRPARRSWRGRRAHARHLAAA